jgi:hypothetical protein
MTDCSICFDSIDSTTGHAKLSCGHEYHISCITEWFANLYKGSCPYCRKEVGEKEDIPFELEYLEGDEDEDEEHEEDDDEDEDDNEDEDYNEDEDEDNSGTEPAESVDSLPTYVDLSRHELCSHLSKYSGIHTEYFGKDEWNLMKIIDEYAYAIPNLSCETPLRFTCESLRCIFVHKITMYLRDEDWMAIYNAANFPKTDAFISASLDFQKPLRLPSHTLQGEFTCNIE